VSDVYKNINKFQDTYKYDFIYETVALFCTNYHS